MAAYEHLLRFLESDKLNGLSGKKLSEAIDALEALVHSYDSTTNNTTNYDNFKNLSNNNKYFWDERPFWTEHDIDFDLVTDGDIRITDDNDIGEALNNINEKANELLTKLRVHNTNLAGIKPQLERIKKEEETFLNTYEKKIKQVLERNNMDLYHSMYNKSEQAAVEIATYEKLAEQFGNELKELKQNKKALNGHRNYLLNCLDTSEINELRDNLSVTEEKIKVHIAQCREAIKKIGNEQDGLLKTIKDAEQLDYIFLGNGVTYTIRTEKTLKEYTPNHSIQAGNKVLYEEITKVDQLKYMSINKRDASEEGVFKKTYLETGGKSAFVLRGNSKKDGDKPLEWESEKFPTTDADRQDHAFRWAIEIVRQRPRSPSCTPIYLIKGTKNPEEIEYLGKALQIVLKWEEEKILKYNPDAKIDANHHKIVTNSKTWQPSGWFGRGLSSLYNTMVNNEMTEQFKKEFQAAKEDIVLVKITPSEKPIVKQKAVDKQEADGKEELVDQKAAAKQQLNKESIRSIKEEKEEKSQENTNTTTAISTNGK